MNLKYNVLNQGSLFDVCAFFMKNKSTKKLNVFIKIIKIIYNNYSYYCWCYFFDKIFRVNF